MTSAIGWYGPLIGLSNAALHVGDFVQLLVLVHRSTPVQVSPYVCVVCLCVICKNFLQNFVINCCVQYKLSNGGEVIRTDIQVGDNTRPFFSVSLWQKQMASVAVAGDIILLQSELHFHLFLIC